MKIQILKKNFLSEEIICYLRMSTMIIIAQYSFFGLFSYSIIEVTYLEWEIGRCPRDEEYPLKGF